jgi:hypothetical protein
MLQPSGGVCIHELPVLSEHDYDWTKHRANALPPHMVASYIGEAY